MMKETISPEEKEGESGTAEAFPLERREPEEADCADEMSPQPMGADGETMTILVAEGLVTITKIFMQKYRLRLYQYLNQRLRDGMLENMTGFLFDERRITREVCTFTGFDQWRIERGCFYFDVRVTLKQGAGNDRPEWRGIIAAFCYFDQGLQCDIKALYDEHYPPDRSECMRLSAFLIPYLTNQEMEKLAEEMLREHVPDALRAPERGNAEKLAAALGLGIRYLPLWNEHSDRGILFYKGGKVQIAEAVQDGEMQERLRIREEEIPVRTIVININACRKEYADSCIYHECIHNELHDLFFELQEIGRSDLEGVKTRKKTIRSGERISDPLFFMEKQASRGADCLMLPLSWLTENIGRERLRIAGYRHMGELYEMIGKRICTRNGIANFLMRRRMIQTGHYEAKGSLNWVDGVHIEPFAFRRGSLEKAEDTFIVSEGELCGLRESSREFREIDAGKRFIYADGHYVKNDPKYVTEGWQNGRDVRLLTPWANAHVDECCLRFTRIYIQVGPGKYIFGRLNCDTEYIERTQFFLRRQTEGNEIIDEGPEIVKYQNAMPETFPECLKNLMKEARMTYEKMAEALNVDAGNFGRWMRGARRMPVSTDMVVMVSLILKLPGWISSTLMSRAGLTLNYKNDRDLALGQILETRWNDGIEKANEYLQQRKHEVLSI